MSNRCSDVDRPINSTSSQLEHRNCRIDAAGFLAHSGDDRSRFDLLMWVLRCVVKGKRCDLGLGSAKLVTLAEARDDAHRLRKIARAGGDPLAERRHERRPVPTFRTAAEEVHKAVSPTFRNPKHSAQWLSSLDSV